MKVGKVFVGIAAVLIMLVCGSNAQEDTSMAMLSIEPTKPARKEPKVTAVYGVSADDYLPSMDSARKHLRPKVRSSAIRPSFNLPDAFYFIGGPVFVFLFLRVMVIFLNGFEETRREEMRTATREVWDAE